MKECTSQLEIKGSSFILEVDIAGGFSSEGNPLIFHLYCVKNGYSLVPLGQEKKHSTKFLGFYLQKH